MVKNFSLILKRSRIFYEKNERYLIPGALVFGIFTDVLLFRSINYEFAFLILSFHIIASGLVIAFMHIYDTGYLRKRFFRFVRLFAPLLLQYTFGALLSASLIFYWFSSAFVAVWPFVLVIIALMLSNDLLRRYYLLLEVRVGVYFFAVFSFSVIVLPFLLKKIGPEVFLLGGALSLFLIGVYLYALSFILREIRKKAHFFITMIGVIFLFFNAMYFFNFIPPVPLSLREAELAYSVQKIDGLYLLKMEDKSFWRDLMPGDRVYTTEGSRLYFFSSVFAPAKLETSIVHNWQYFDKKKRQWVSVNKVVFPIIGGRDGGYRGYSFSGKVTSGRWRVLIETPRGQVVGKKSFRVVTVLELPDVVEEIR